MFDEVEPFSVMTLTGEDYAGVENDNTDEEPRTEAVEGSDFEETTESNDNTDTEII